MAQQVPPWFQNVHSCNITVQAAEYVVQQSGMMLQQEQQQQGGIKSATKQHAKKLSAIARLNSREQPQADILARKQQQKPIQGRNILSPALWCAHAPFVCIMHPPTATIAPPTRILLQCMAHTLKLAWRSAYRSWKCRRPGRGVAGALAADLQKTHGRQAAKAALIMASKSWLTKAASGSVFRCNARCWADCTRLRPGEFFPDANASSSSLTQMQEGIETQDAGLEAGLAFACSQGTQSHEEECSMQE
eukprot:1048289-Pelagomonas_calceolata.AAC.2